MIPPGVYSSQLSIFGGTRDSDVYIRFGSRPTLTEWDCRSYLEGNEESITIPTPAAGDWYIMLHGYDNYSDVKLFFQ